MLSAAMLSARSSAGLLLAAACTSSPQPSSSVPTAVPAPGATAGNCEPAASGPAKPPLDPEIRRMVGSVRSERLLDDVKRLAAFGTRHSLSDVTSDTRGIGAAARFLKARFEENITASSGRLEVRFQDFTAPQGPRIPSPWPMQNVLAVLPRQRDRRSCAYCRHQRTLRLARERRHECHHRRSGRKRRCQRRRVVLEACRALAPYSFEATIVFAAVTGEEQGLLGSEAMVADFTARGVRVEAMFTNDIVGASRSAAGRKDTSQVRVFSQGLPNGCRAHVISCSPSAANPTVPAASSPAPSRKPNRAMCRRSARCSFFGSIAICGAAITAVSSRRHARGPLHGGRRKFQPPASGRAGGSGYRIWRRPRARRRRVHADVARVNIAALATVARAPSAPSPVRLEAGALDEDSTLRFVPGPRSGRQLRGPGAADERAQLDAKRHRRPNRHGKDTAIQGSPYFRAACSRAARAPEHRGVSAAAQAGRALAAQLRLLG